MDEETRDATIRDNIAPELEGLFVTPKTVDIVITRLAQIIANGLNQALHPGIGAADVNRYLN
jgi:spore protease